MKKMYLTPSATFVTGLVLVLPTLYFIIAAFAWFQLHISGPWQLIKPIFEKPENQGIGLNINLLILFGPLAALLLNLTQVIHVNIRKYKTSIETILQIQLASWNWLVILISLFCITCLFLYGIAENCNCH